MDMTSYLLGKNAGGGGGGATYTAGTNIEITEQNVINNTIPFEYGSTNNKSMKLGSNAGFSGSESTIVGQKAAGLNAGATALGYNTQAASHAVSLGNGANAGYNYSIALGTTAATTAQNQLMIGSSFANINEAKIYTSNGAKKLATEDMVGKVHYIEDNSVDNPFIFDDHEEGIYFFKDTNFLSFDTSQMMVYAKGVSSQNVTSVVMTRGSFLQITKKYSTASTNDVFAIRQSKPTINYGTLADSIGTLVKVTNGDGIAFSTIVQNPSYATDITSIFTSLSGYNGSKTQVLKNVNGALTWVDES